VELVEQDDKGDETTVSKRELEGDWSEDIQWPGSFVTGSDQRNRYTAIYTIGYQFEGATRSGRVSEREFGRYYLGMPCSITLNLYGSVIYDDCGLSTGR
jgi:hypothetical protein